MISRVSPVDFEKLRVMIVDDNTFVRKLERSMLRQLGILDISEAESGLDAIERLANRDCDLVLLDWKMPKLCGEEFLKALRGCEDPYFLSLPIIIVTGLANQPLVLKAVRLGANGVIVKPFSISLLKHRIEAVMLMRHCNQQLQLESHLAEERDNTPNQEDMTFDIDTL